MHHRWIGWINLFMCISVLLTASALFYFKTSKSKEIFLASPQDKSNSLPKNSFQFSLDKYEKIDGDFLHLTSSVPTLQLPDLKTHLIYLGKNGRPDAQVENAQLHFSLTGPAKQTTSAFLNEKVYLTFDKGSKQMQYLFSPNNEKTALWFEASLGQSQDLIIHVNMEDEDGKKVKEPAHYAQFRLPEKEFIAPRANWEIDQMRVDGTLLARLKARWYGPDKFLENHGGKEFAFAQGRERIDFGEGEDLYYVFVKAGESLVWKDGRWQQIEPGQKTVDLPLLSVKKIDDRLIAFELWNIDGKAKVTLNLLKSNEPWRANNGQAIQQAFKFVGARTKTQNLFEINKTRTVIRPNDWLLLTSKGWKKLQTPEEIDRYVQRKERGMLFVFEGWKSKEDRQTMIGTLYNISRSNTETVELTMQNSKPRATAKKPAAKNSDDDDDDDDDDEEFIEKMLSSLKQTKKELGSRTDGSKERQVVEKKEPLNKREIKNQRTSKAVSKAAATPQIKYKKVR